MWIVEHCVNGPMKISLFKSLGGSEGADSLFLRLVEVIVDRHNLQQSLEILTQVFVIFRCQVLHDLSFIL